MKDLVTKGTGNSRYMKSAIGASETWEQAREKLRNGTFPFDLNGLNEAGIEQMGMALSKQNLLSDETAAALGLSGDPTVDDAFGALNTSIETMKPVLAYETPFSTSRTSAASSISATTIMTFQNDSELFQTLLQERFDTLYFQFNMSGSITRKNASYPPNFSICLDVGTTTSVEGVVFLQNANDTLEYNVAEPINFSTVRPMPLTNEHYSLKTPETVDRNNNYLTYGVYNSYVQEWYFQTRLCYLKIVHSTCTYNISGTLRVYGVHSLGV